MSPELVLMFTTVFVSWLRYCISQHIFYLGQPVDRRFQNLKIRLLIFFLSGLSSNGAATPCSDIVEVTSLIMERKPRKWSRELVVRAIQALHQQGARVSLSAVRDSFDEGHLPLLREVLGFEATGAQLFKAGYRYFGNWNAALEAAGISPVADRLLIQWSKESVIELIQKLKNRGILLHYSYVRNDPDRYVANVLAERFGKSVKGGALIGAATNQFGSWDDALRASGLDPSKISPQNSWTRDLFKSGLLALIGGGVSINAGTINSDTSLRGSQLVRSGTGFLATPAALYDTGIRFFGSWDAALRYAGIDPLTTRLRKEFVRWSPALIVECIDRLSLSMNLNWQTIADADKEEFSKILEGILGQSASPGTLLKAADGYFGNWSNALEAAGFSADGIRIHVRWSAELVVQCILELHRLGLALDWRSIAHADREVFGKNLEGILGRPVSPHALLGAARSRFGNWSIALEAAGLNPYAIRLRGRWTRELFLESLRALNASNLYLDPKSIRTDPEGRVTTILSLKNQRVVIGSSFLLAARLFFSSWTEAIRAINLDPENVYAPRVSPVSHDPLRVTGEWTEDPSGHPFFQRQLSLIEPPAAPDAEMEAAELTDVMAQVIGSMPPGDAKIVRVIMELLDEAQIEDLGELSNEVSLKLEIPVDEGKIRRIFAALATDKRITSLRNSD